MCGERGEGGQALGVCSCAFSVSVSLSVSVSSYVYVSQFARLELIIHNIQSEVCVRKGGGPQSVVGVCFCLSSTSVTVSVSVSGCVYASQFAGL